MAWEVVVFDEAHRLKSHSTKVYAAALQLRTSVGARRYGLTGTVRVAGGAAGSELK